MNYQLNAEAYLLLSKIEVGIREFLVSLIKDIGITEWTKDFLGTNHSLSLKEIGTTIYNYQKNGSEPPISDIYLAKMLKSFKVEKEARRLMLFHPFYYLTWNELENVMRMNKNGDLISASIGGSNKNLVIDIFKSLNPLRNDLAHSRTITQEDFNFIKSCFSQLESIIKDFERFYLHNGEHDNFVSQMEEMSSQIEKISARKEMASAEDLQNMLLLVHSLLNSFWINTLLPEFILSLYNLREKIEQYAEYRKKPAGLLDIVQWKTQNQQLLRNIQIIINDFKIRN